MIVIKRISIIRMLTCALMLSLSITSHAESSAMAKTKSQLKELENKMSQLQSRLNSAHNKQEILNRELAITEKNLTQGSVQLKKLQQSIKEKQQQIDRLQEQVNALGEKLVTQQRLLARHIRARYKIGEHEPLKLLLNQDSPDRLTRILTLYQYLVHSRQQVMDDVIKTKKALAVNHAKLHDELLAQQQLQQQLHDRQKTFDHEKNYRVQLVKSLAKDIKDQQQTLQDCQKNKQNLSRILTTLVQQSVLQTRHPLTQMRHKLAMPVHASKQDIKKINQGVVFFVNEGSPVMSVAPGKVVFADWLNGYGLLVIVDHGWGFMTLYANNKSLVKHKGESVRQGESIAIAGHSGTLKQNGLYFEIRQRGKAINPFEWLS